MPRTARADEWQLNHIAYRRLLATLRQEFEAVYVVGGAVRDYILGDTKHVADLDIVIEGRALLVAKSLADRLGWAFYAMDEVRDIVRLVFTANPTRSLICDISSMRGLTIEDDLRSRDFTINAMAVAYRKDRTPELLDLHNGQDDLEKRVLCRVSALSLSEDSVRLLRAPRLMAQLDLSLESGTRSQIERLADTVLLTSPERIQYELWRMTTSQNPSRAFMLMHRYGLLSRVLPAVAATVDVEQSAPHVHDVFQHTLEVVKWASRLRDWLIGDVATISEDHPELQRLLAAHEYKLRRHFSEALSVGRSRADWLVWHALLHDIGKPSTASIEYIVTDDITNNIEGNSGDATGVTMAKFTKKIRFLSHEEAGAALASERLEHLRFSRREISLCASVIANHMRLHHLHYNFGHDNISQRSIYRFYRSTGGQHPERMAGIDVVLLSLADYLGTYRNLTDDWPVYLSHAAQLIDDAFTDETTSVSQTTPLINGYQLMQHLGLKPGPHIGDLLEQLMEAQATGEIITVEEALELAEELSTGTKRTEDI